MDARIFKVADGYSNASLEIPGTIAAQEQNTRILSCARPRYHEMSTEQLPKWLDERLHLPVVATSDGPTFMDKHYL